MKMCNNEIFSEASDYTEQVCCITGEPCNFSEFKLRCPYFEEGESVEQ